MNVDKCFGDLLIYSVVEKSVNIFSFRFNVTVNLFCFKETAGLSLVTMNNKVDET